MKPCQSMVPVAAPHASMCTDGRSGVSTVLKSSSPMVGELNGLGCGVAILMSCGRGLAC
jgi:hypothetical protein